MEIRNDRLITEWGSSFWICLRNPQSVTGISQLYFPEVQFIMLYKVVLAFEILTCGHSIQSYTEHSFPVVLFVKLQKDEILKCDQIKATER